MSSQTIHLMRHAEAAHNVDNDLTLPDPLLTANGVAEAERFLEGYPFLSRPTLILVSPLRRCIQTALSAFDPATNPRAAHYFDHLPRIVCVPHLQETTENPCDTGSSLVTLKAEYRERVEFPDHFFADDEWYKKTGTAFANENNLLSERGEFVRNFILQCADQEIVVVTHADFCHFLVNRWLYGPGCGTLFNGLQRAKGVPMRVVSTTDGTELQVEFPSWFKGQ